MYNSQSDYKEIQCEHAGRIHLAQNRDWRLVVVNMVLNIPFHKMREISFPVK
jgi:hypothetical protein